MKTTLLLISLFALLSLSIYTQQKSAFLYFEQHSHHTDLLNEDQMYLRSEQEYKLNVDNRNIPIKTNNGKAPDERQLEIIKNTITEDFLVNDDTEGSSFHYFPSIIFDAMGNSVIVWEDNRLGTENIYFQRYNSSGAPQGVNTQVSKNSIYADVPSISMDGLGNFIIVWEDRRNGNADIYYQRYNSNGAAQGTNTLVNDDVGSAHQFLPIISMNASGNFVIVWEDQRNGDKDIYYQQFNSNGVAQGTNTKVNDDNGNYIQQHSSLSMDAIGNFVVVWEDNRSGNSDIYFQRYNSSGVAQGTNTRANDDAGIATQARPSISMDGSGNFAVVWHDSRNGDYDIFCQRYTSLGIEQGTNTKVNDDAGSVNQFYPKISMNSTGDYTIVWYTNGSGNDDIFCQIYNSSGVPLGQNFVVNDDVGGADQYDPSICFDRTGRFMVAWSDERAGNPDIYCQLYNSIGIAQGINKKVNDDVGSSDQYYPAISSDELSNFVIVWSDKRFGNSNIYYQKFNSIGAAQGINIKVNDDAGDAAHYAPSISMNKAGHFAIVWYDNRNGNYDIYCQMYNSSCVAQGSNFKVNDDVGTAYQYNPAVAVDELGNFVIVWYENRNSNYDIYFQRYNSSGVAQGTNIKVNDDAGSAAQYATSISMDNSGNFVILWYDNRNNNYDIYYQRYNSNGVAQGPNTKVNDDAGIAPQYSPSVAIDGSGNFVIVWYDFRNGDSDIYSQRYNSNDVAQGINLKVNDDAGNAVQNRPRVSMDGNGNFLVVWQDYRFGVNNPDIIGQRYFAGGSPNGANYKIVSDGPNRLETYPVVCSNNTNIIFSWQDNRRAKGWDVYAKIVGWDWDGVTFVAEVDKNFPNEFSLSQNYPNPFNPVTKIQFAVPQDVKGETSNVILKVYDVLGNEVAILVDEHRTAGSYEVEFQSAVGGKQLASGIYYYQLKAGDFVDTKKMILLR